MSAEKLLSEKELVQLTGFAVQTLRNWRAQNKGFAFYKVGRAVRYRMTDIEAFLKKHRVDPESLE